MTFDASDLTAIGGIIIAVGGGLAKGLLMILASAKEQREAQAATADRMMEALSAMQKDAHKVIERNTVAIERGAVATRDLTEAVERLTGRVELVERVVGKAETQKFSRAG